MELEAPEFKLGGNIYRPSTNKIGSFNITLKNVEKYTILIKDVVENKRNDKFPIATYYEKPYLITLKNHELLDKYLREDVLGMCDHTQDRYDELNTWNKNDLKIALDEWKIDKNPENINLMRVRGVCTTCRQESFTELLKKYINEKCADEDYDYSFKEFRKDYVQSVEELLDIESNFSVTDGSSRIKDVTNSNGIEVHQFNISKTYDSKRSKIKNTIKGGLGLPKRQSVTRTSHAMSFASKDSGEIKRWRKEIVNSLDPSDLNQEYRKEVRDLLEFLKVDPLAEDDSRKIAYMNIWENVLIQKNETEEMDELVRGTMKLPFDILDVFYKTVPLVDRVKDADILERYLFGWINHEDLKSTQEFSHDFKLNFKDDPFSKKESETYGRAFNRALVCAQLDELVEVPLAKSVMSYISSWFGESFRGTFEKDDNSGYEMDNGNYKFFRHFCLKKSIFSESKPTGEFEDFTLYYEDEKRDSDWEAATMISQRGYKAKLGRLMLKFTKIKDSVCYSKDSMRKTAMEMVELILKEKVDDNLCIQLEALTTLKEIVKDSQDTKLQNKVISMFAKIIDKDINTQLNTATDRKNAEMRAYVQDKAVQILVEVVRHKSKFMRVDEELIDLLLRAIDAVKVTVPVGGTPTVQAYTALNELESISSKALQVAESEKTKNFYKKDYVEKLDKERKKTKAHKLGETIKKLQEILKNPHTPRELCPSEPKKSKNYEEAYKQIDQVQEDFDNKVISVEVLFKFDSKNVTHVDKKLFGFFPKEITNSRYVRWKPATRPYGSFVLRGESSQLDELKRLYAMIHDNDKVKENGGEVYHDKPSRICEDFEDCETDDSAFLEEAMNELNEILEDSNIDNQPHRTDLYLQLLVLQNINYLLKNASDFRTQVDFVLESSPDNLWGAKLDDVPTLETDYYKDIMSSIGQALQNMTQWDSRDPYFVDRYTEEEEEEDDDDDYDDEN